MTQTTESFEDTFEGGGSESGFPPPLPNPAPEDVTAPDTPAAEQSADAVETAPEAEAAAPTEGNWFADKPELNAKIAELAKQIPNLKASDPEGLKTLRRIAEKDLHIERLKAQLETGDTAAPTLTEYEKTLKQPPPAPERQQAQQQAPPPQQPQQPQQQTNYEDIGRDWRDMRDVAKAEAAAWGRVDDKGKPGPGLRGSCGHPQHLICQTARILRSLLRGDDQGLF
jgi:hypothetical protein